MQKKRKKRRLCHSAFQDCERPHHKLNNSISRRIFSFQSCAVATADFVSVERFHNQHKGPLKQRLNT